MSSTDQSPSQLLDSVNFSSSLQPRLLHRTTSVPLLPMSQPVTELKFVWGTIDSVNFIYSLDVAYCEVMHWIQNSFIMPWGSAGHTFVSKLARWVSLITEME